MAALITGASGGIGYYMAKALSEMGFDTIIVARNEEKLNMAARDFKTKTTVIKADLSKKEECLRVYESIKDEQIEVVINNAGFGEFGAFDEGDLENELNMIDLNIKAVHIFTKLFLKRFVERGYGYILNVASLAAFLPGPMMAAYYGTKAYVYRLTMAVREELKRKKSPVYCGVLCPGPVATRFNKRAGVRFATKGLDAEKCAYYAIEQMFKERGVIIPGSYQKLLPAVVHLAPEFLQTHFCFEFQKRKDSSL